MNNYFLRAFYFPLQISLALFSLPLAPPNTVCLTFVQRQAANGVMCTFSRPSSENCFLGGVVKSHGWAAQLVCNWWEKEREREEKNKSKPNPVCIASAVIAEKRYWQVLKYLVHALKGNIPEFTDRKGFSSVSLNRRWGRNDSEPPWVARVGAIDKGKAEPGEEIIS